MLVTLCVGDLGVIGVQPDFALGNDIGRNKLNFGYGVNFKYNGEIHNNLDRVWVVQRFNLPKGLTSYFTGMKFGLNCEYSNLRPQYADKAGAFDSLSRINFIKEVCRQTRPMLAQLEKGAYFYQKTIERLVNGDIPNALHKLPVVEEIRYKRSKQVSENLIKQEIPEHLQAGGSDIQHVSNVYTNTSLSEHVRKKRGLLGLAIPIVGKLATIAIEALGSHLQKKRRRAMAKALERLESKQFLNKNQLYKLDHDFLMFGDYDIQTTDGMIKLLGNLNNRTQYLENIITGKDPTTARNFLKNHLRGTEIFSHQVQMYMQAMRERYLRVPENLISELRLLLRSIAILSRGYLPPQLFSPTDIVRISQAALSMIKNKHPDYVLAIPQASSYYDMRLVTFGIDENDRLVVCFPIFVKDFSRKSMTLYQIETVPVPILDTNEEANSYSQAVINKPYIATNNDYYIQLKIEELFMCKQIKHIYFCEELFLVKHKTKHSCESALFYNLESAFVKQNCQFKYFYNTTVIPSVLDGGSEIVLANMLNEKRLICTYDQGLAKPLPASPYVLVDRRLLCHCHIQSGLTYVLKTIGSCNSTDQPVLYYTVNLAFLNYFSTFLNGSVNIPSNPMEDETVLPIAMEDFSKDPDFPVYCQDSSMFPTFLDQLVHVHYQKKLFLQSSRKHSKEFPFEGRAGMNEVQVSVTPEKVPSGNSFSFMFTVAFHLYVFLGTTISMIMLLPQVYMLLKQKKLRGLVGAITMFKQATRASATPTGLPPTRVICHDPWVSLVLTCLTIAGILAYIYKHGRQLSLIYGHRFTNICKVYVLISNHTHYVKLKVAEMCGNPNLFTCNKNLEMNNVTMQKGYIWDYIHITWEEVNIRHAQSEIQVRQHMSVPLIDRIRMRRIFPHSVDYSFMVQQGDTWMNVPLDPSIPRE